MEAASIVAFRRAKSGQTLQILEKSLKLLFKRDVAYSAGRGHRLHTLKARPLRLDSLRQSFGHKGPRVAHHGDVRAVIPVLWLEPEIGNHRVQRVDQRLQFVRHNGRAEARDSRSGPVLEPVEIQSE